MENCNSFDDYDGIAIIGMAGRFPGADDVDSLWQNLCKGVESIEFFKEKDLDPSISESDYRQPGYVKAKGIINGPDKFDAGFFRITPREAEIMDPQQRIFLEIVSEALEKSGYVPESYEGLIGLFAGSWRGFYFENLIKNHDEIIDLIGDYQAYLANGPDYLTTKVSYKLNLKGPSITVQTGCSTSLVAVSMAADSLMNYQCDIALAGGVYIQFPFKSGYLYQEGGMRSKDGHCRPFDKDATGTLFSDGAGVVVLKRLSEAVEDKDTIYAVIKGSAINNDGSDKISYTAPSVKGIAEVIEMAQENAEVHPETISFVECHGTGTVLGDPIEIEAMSQAFNKKTNKKNFCSIGSIKANIGHLDAAAGIAGLIKTALMLFNKKIPPSINFETINPQIEIENTPFYTNTSLSEWESSGIRRAGVSSLGVGGTNVHVVLEEAPDIEISSDRKPWDLIVISANTDSALDKATAKLADCLKQNPGLNLSDVSYTLQIGRKSFEHRRVAVCKDLDHAVNNLKTLDPKFVKTSAQKAADSETVFMFSGQGTQYLNMGLELYRAEPIFREAIDRCSQILQPYLSLDLKEILYPKESKAKDANQILNQTRNTQPALFAIEYALAKLWMSWGIKPDAMVGHSIGEYVAACLAGVFTLEDGLSLVATRGRLMQSLPEGSMLAVLLPANDIRQLIKDDLSVAAINTPNLCVISGENKAVEDFEKELSNKGIHSTRLHTSHGFHSPMMEPIMEEFAGCVDAVERGEPTIPYVSNVSGTWIQPSEASSPDYWARHLRQPVKFSACIETLFQEPNRVFLEIGPGHTLSTLVRQHPERKNSHFVVSSIRHPKEQIDDRAFIMLTVGDLWLLGIDIDWHKLEDSKNRRRIPLPTYPFERKRYLISATKQNGSRNPDPSDVYDTQQTDADIKSSYEGSVVEHHAGNSDLTVGKIEKTVANIFKELLGVEQVGVNDNFFSLGGSSIIAVGLFAQLEKKFGKTFPLATLYEEPTVGGLSRLIADESWEAPWNTIVKVHGEGPKTPLFFAHAAGGNILLYRELAQYLGADQPVYGLQCRGLDGESPLHSDIESMAADYIKELKSAFPNGPYMLGGYCMGGTVAFEMAQKLRKMGDEVPLLALFETYNYSKIKQQTFIDNIHYYIQKVDFHFRNFLLLNQKDKWQFFKEKAKVASGRKKVWLGMLTEKCGFQTGQTNGQAALLANIWQNNDQVSAEYVPEVYPGHITVFLPVKEYVHHIGPEIGWEGLAAGGLDVHTLPVYPAGMMVEPFVKMLAAELKNCIENAQKKSSATG